MNGLESNGYQRHLSLYNKGVCVAQEKQDFPVILSSDYLAVPNNLLLSLSLSLSLSLIGATGVTSYTNILLYARVKNGAKPLGKGLARDSVACFVVPVGQVTRIGLRKF